MTECSMQTMTALEPKPSKRRSPARPAKTSTAPKTKLTLYVTAEGAKRLAVFATMTESDRSAVVEQLIADHLKRFVVSNRAKPADEGNRRDSDDQESESASRAA